MEKWKSEKNIGKDDAKKNFGIVRLGMVLLSEAQSALQDSIWASLTLKVVADPRCDRKVHAVISRREIDIGKEIQRLYEHFDVTISIGLLDKPQFAMQDRMWAE